MLKAGQRVSFVNVGDERRGMIYQTINGNSCYIGELSGVPQKPMDIDDGTITRFMENLAKKYDVKAVPMNVEKEITFEIQEMDPVF